ncbi:alcohol dehydrogenase [Halocatena halophila]|uniref:alcohol dehydrogenase n=1 Tax=Halocatena halophila TaxID=2814576 RepID=UPI002ED25B8D
MKAVQVSAAGEDFEHVDQPIPDPGPEEVRIAVEACGVCGGDAVLKEGAYPGINYPHIPGHEIAGQIDVVGTDVEKWDIGDQVGVAWHGGHCFVCDPCRRGDFVNCENGSITGITFDGGYAEYTTAPAEALARIPDELDAPAAAPLVCAGLTPFNSLRSSPAGSGDLVVIQGIGGVGHMGVQIATAMGFETVAVSRGPAKESLAFELGADHYLDANEQEPAVALQSMGGADVILTTAPNAQAIGSIAGGLKENGQLLVIAEPHDPVELPLSQFIANRQSMQAWNAGHARDAQDALEFCALHGIEPMIETYPLEDASRAFERMSTGNVRFRAVLLPGQ